MSCHEVSDIGRNLGLRGAAISYRELLRNDRNGMREGAARSCREVPEIGRNKGTEGAAMR